MSSSGGPSCHGSGSALLYDKNKPGGSSKNSSSRIKNASSNGSGASSSSSSNSSAGSTGSTGGPTLDEGVWKNSRFAHTMTSLVGLTVTVETQSEGTFEGILWTISRFLDVVLVQSHLVNLENPTEIKQETLEDKRTFHAKDIVRLTALDVDLDYATKKTFQTDFQISGKSGNGPLRELEEWKPEEGEGEEELEGGSLEGSHNGWKPEDMFAKNEQNYGVKSTYKDNLEGYTCQLSLEGRDSLEYKQKEAKASEIARQIEQSGSSSTAIELENGEGDNEEEAFSAVQRSHSPHVHAQHNHRYSYQHHPRSHRESSNDESSHGVGGGGHSSNNSSNNNNNKYIPPSRRGHKNAPPNRSHNDRDNDHESSSGGYHHNNHHHHNHHHASPANHHHSHNHYANYKNNSSSEDKQHYQHRSNSYNNSSSNSHGKPPRISKSLNNNNNNSGHNSPANINNNNPSNTPPSHVINNNNNNNSLKSKQQQAAGGESASSPPEVKKMMNTNAKMDHPSTTTSSTPPDIQTLGGVEEGGKPERASPEDNKARGGGPSSQTEESGNSSAKPRVHFVDQSSSPSALGTTTSSSPPSTTASTNNNNTSASNTAPPPPPKKSGLNPNAKEFVLNPNAKMFTSNISRPPMSTTPSRPQTPATPVGTPFTTQTFIPGFHIPTSSQGARNRSQRGEYHRPDLTSPIQVAAAGGGGGPLVPVSYTSHHIPFQPATGTPPHHHPHQQQHGVVMRMGLQHNFSMPSEQPLSMNSPAAQQAQWASSNNPGQPLNPTPPSHTPSPGPQVIFPLAAMSQQHSVGNNQAPPVNSLAYTTHHHPSSGANFAASPGNAHYHPHNLLPIPQAVLSGHPPMIHPPLLPSQQGHVLTTYITPTQAVPGHQNHLLHSHIAQ